jgi:hypothetical protein
MKPFWISLPFALLTAAMISSLLLSYLQLPVFSAWLPAITSLFTVLLWQRHIVELMLVAVVAGITQMSFEPGSNSPVSADMLLALLIALVTVPALLSSMGIITPSMGSGQSPRSRRA